MIKIRPDQHAKILGFALIGYGLQFLSGFFSFLSRIPYWFTQGGSEYAFVARILDSLENYYLPILLLAVSIIAGISTLSMKSKSKLPGLLFVLAGISFFPLGTMLSGYVLVYLFVFKNDDFPMPDFVPTTKE